jgi:phage FluMu protein gp41
MEEEQQNFDYMKTLESFKEIILKQQEMIEKLIELNSNSSMKFIPMIMGLLKYQINSVGGKQHPYSPEQQQQTNEKFVDELLKRMSEGPKS